MKHPCEVNLDEESDVSGAEPAAAGERSHLLYDNPLALNQCHDSQWSCISHGDYIDFQMCDLGPPFCYRAQTGLLHLLVLQNNDPLWRFFFPGQTFFTTSHKFSATTWQSIGLSVWRGDKMCGFITNHLGCEQYGE